MIPSSKSDTQPDIKVLLVEDDRDALEELVDIVELEDWTASCAYGVEQALTMIAEDPEISVIVTDVHIVELSGVVSNGIQLVTRAQARFPERQLSFVVLSGDASAVGSSIQNGAVDFLTKPLAPDDLVAAIREAYNSAGHERTVAELTEFLMRKVAKTTQSLQRASTDLEAREVEISGSRREAGERRTNAQTIRNALRNEFIQPWFQPQVHLATGRICGLEALARWIEPDGTRKSPAEFLPQAEQSGTLGELDEVIRTHAMRTIRHFERSGITDCAIGINITAMQLGSPDFVDQILREAAEIQLAPQLVGIEILETAMLDGEASGPIRENLQRLSDHGFKIELDDFGTGHAGIASLRDFAVDRVKIDRSYVENIHENPSLQKFTRTLIALAKGMDIEVLAEGVECAGEIEWLHAEGCDVIQGFHIARPMPADEAMAWARTNIQSPTKEV